MDVEVSALYRDLNDHMGADRALLERAVEQFEAEAAEANVLYAGSPLAVGFYPLILSKGQLGFISSVAEAMLRLMEKATALFLENPSVREVFDFSPQQLELIEVDPGYEHAIPCARFDSFFDGEDIHFTEINTDGTAGMDGSEKISKLFQASPFVKDLFPSSRVSTFDISQNVLDTLLDCYGQFAGSKSAKKPRIAIVDWKETRTSAEFFSFAEYCRSRGYEAVVADPRDLEYDGKTLSYEGSTIDLIYRRVVSGEYIERLDEVEAMTRAFKEHHVCVVGSFRSDVAFSKKVFGLLHTPEFGGLFTEEELALAQKHVPWTQPFGDRECDYRGKSFAMPELARANKDDFVLKPSSLYEGRGISLGFDKTTSQWDAAIEAALKGDYILQEFIREVEMPVGALKDEFKLEPRFIHIGEYIFGGKLAGLYCRAAEGPLIDMTSRECVIPCLVFAPSRA